MPDHMDHRTCCLMSGWTTGAPRTWRWMTSAGIPEPRISVARQCISPLHELQVRGFAELEYQIGYVRQIGGYRTHQIKTWLRISDRRCSFAASALFHD